MWIFWVEPQLHQHIITSWEGPCQRIADELFIAVWLSPAEKTYEHINCLWVCVRLLCVCFRMCCLFVYFVCVNVLCVYVLCVFAYCVCVICVHITHVLCLFLLCVWGGTLYLLHKLYICVLCVCIQTNSRVNLEEHTAMGKNTFETEK